MGKIRIGIPLLRLLPAVLVIGTLSGRALGQLPAKMGAPGAAASSTSAPNAPAGAVPIAATPATRTQPISVQAGTGVLLRLPQAAATVMSAEPGIARVQPASPTSLFLMGVAPGHTTVIATTDAGNAIVQYDVSVTPGAGGTSPVQPPSAPLGVSA